MAAVKNGVECLRQLKASQLHQLAVVLGSASSGSKGTVADGICRTLESALLDTSDTSNSLASSSAHGSRHLSIVSIDMGIQNLAYAHLLAPQTSDRNSESSQRTGINRVPLLSAWDRLAAFPADKQDNSITESGKSGSYNPSKYASAAYHFITELIAKYDPTHILIEQQRFRSGGGSAVAEWTIRVGVFEGMLHAILRTLREERKGKINLQTVTSINPAQTARFWLEGSGRAESRIEPRKITGREGKQAKINIVGKSFLCPNDQLVETGAGQAKAMETAFLERWNGTSKAAEATKATKAPLSPKKVASSTSSREFSEPKQPKLDDLADCLLQAIAWLEWQRMRELVTEDMSAPDPVAAIQQRLQSVSQIKAMPRREHLRINKGLGQEVRAEFPILKTA
jgi:cruciform cutting endonuclease 1